MAVVLFFFKYFCLFKLYLPTRELLLLRRRRHHYRWRAANFDIYSAQMVIEQWRFFSVPHLLRHGTSVYNGHLQVTCYTHIYCKSVGIGADITCFNDLGQLRQGFEHPTFRLQGERCYRLGQWYVAEILSIERKTLFDLSINHFLWLRYRQRRNFGIWKLYNWPFHLLFYQQTFRDIITVARKSCGIYVFVSYFIWTFLWWSFTWINYI